METGIARPENVRATLDRAIAAGALGRSDQLVRFLRFVVERTLAGHGDSLKEYTIGVEALGRSVTFDPTRDAVVRVQARQLRYRLAEYFGGRGRDEPIVIDLPKGSYAPVFSVRAPVASAPPPASARPSVVRLRGPALAVSILAALALGAVGATVFRGRTTGAAHAGDHSLPSIVVLPFSSR